jgi:hypothetical protein
VRVVRAGEVVIWRLVGVATLASGPFVMIEGGLAFSLCPGGLFSKSALASQYLRGACRDGDGIKWDLGRKRWLGL